jgi:hypothetical protein
VKVLAHQIVAITTEFLLTSKQRLKGHTMEFNIPEIETIKKAKAKYEEAVKSIGKVGFANAAKTLFEKHPTLTYIKWLQYTPYFNDGETCEFGIHGVYYSEAPIEKDEDGNIQIDDGSEEYAGYSNPRGKNKVLASDMKDFEQLVESLSDSCKDAFGDHVQVIITTEGVEVTDYEHD